MIIVKVIQLGGEIRDIKLEKQNVTVQELMDEIGQELIEGNVTVNNGCANGYTNLRDGDRVYIGSPTKGNLPFEAQFIKLGAASDNSVFNLPADDNYTIKQTLNQLAADKRGQFFNANGDTVYEYRIGSSTMPVADDAVIPRPVQGSVRIFCSQKTKGNE